MNAQVAAITDKNQRSLCAQMAKLKTRGKKYVLIPDVIKDLQFKSIKREGPNDPINFTNSNIPVTRRMKLAPNPELYIPNVLTALSTVFPGCNSTLVKVITSQRGDKEQLLHTDFDLKYIISRVFNLDSFHYSAIIALQPDTHLLVRGKRERIDIPVNSRLLFRGDLPHAGGAYKKATVNKVIKISILLRY